MNANHHLFDFGFLTGDFILHPTEKNWKEIDSVSKDWVPELHYVAGNHDYGNGLIFEKRSGGSNRFFYKGNTLFVILNLTNTGWLIREDQWKMILDGLNKSDTKISQVFVLTHQVAYLNSSPLFQNVQPNSFDGSAGDLKFFETNLEKFIDLGVPIFFIAGDVGAIAGRSGSSYHKVENLHLIASGMGNSETDNFLSVKVMNDSIMITKINLVNGASTPLSNELIRISKY